MPPSGGLCRREPTPPQAKRERETRWPRPGKSCPGKCQEEGGISEKENGASSTENISTERTAKGSPERRKGSLKPRVTEEGQSHPRASPWVPQRHNRLENENPTRFHLQLEILTHESPAQVHSHSPKPRMERSFFRVFT